jgi:pyridinium-3,5-biscarboxylic acid mononucleotide sulfurtransferase
VELVAGFDLDMTLVDSRAGIVHTLQDVVGEYGVELTDDDVWPTIGIPLKDALVRWLPEPDVDNAFTTYRERYPALGVPLTTVLPGAAEALSAVRELGGRVAVVSAKAEPAVRAVLERVGLEADLVVGDRFALGKAEVLREIRAQIYVGDHPGDVAAALGAQAVSVAVSTGPTPARDLATAGADIVLEDLRDFPAWLAGHVLAVRLAELDAALTALTGPAVVAFSGGTDSAFVLAAAVRALGPDRVVAATAVSPSLATGELERAAAFATGLGVRHETPATHELDRPGYVTNAGDRCYYCKSELIDVLTALDPVVAGATVITGTNADDARAGFRPGIRAAEERGAFAPLRDVGLTKAQIREASRRWGLTTWDKPAAACLSSRVAYGVPVTRDALARIDRAEQALRAALDTITPATRSINLRVRDLGDDRARLEIDRWLLDRLDDAAPEDHLAAAVRSAGFTTVDIDPRGFRSGSMNDLLPQPELYR